MKLLSKEDILANETMYTSLLKKSVFIYPTDTIYGIGCNAEDSSLVNRIRGMKKRKEQPFSVIAPSKDWIIKNCEIPKEGEEWLNKIPGPYTLILVTKENIRLADNVNPSKDSLGVRIPKNWFSEFVSRMGIPVVTTSVNKTAEPYMISMENIDPDIKEKVDFIIYEGEKNGRPSTIVDFTKGMEIRER